AYRAHRRRGHPSLPTRRSSDLALGGSGLAAKSWISARVRAVLAAKSITPLWSFSSSASAGPPGGRHALAELEKLHKGVMLFAAKDRKSTRLNSSHLVIWYAVFC